MGCSVMRHHADAMGDGDPLSSELKVLSALEQSLRESLYSIDGGGKRAIAVAAVAAAAAERAYLLSDALPEWCNATSDAWRGHLADVWRYLEGDRERHRAISSAIAVFLTSPLNHNEGQEGPDDFDRPQTIASYSAAASVVLWGVDFATTAVGQIFELVDLRYDGEMPSERRVDVERELDWAVSVGRIIDSVALSDVRLLTTTLLSELRG